MVSYTIMTIIIAVISQKGGVGKSTISRAIAVQVAKENLRPLLADLDVQQKTSYDWAQRRQAHDETIQITSRAYNSHDEALTEMKDFDVIILDSKGYTDQQTADICQKSDLILHPCGFSVDDRKPTFITLNTLVKLGIEKARLNVVLVGDHTEASEAEIRAYFSKGGYHVIDGFLRKKKIYELALNEGLSVTEASRKDYRIEASKLTEAISKRLEAVL